MRVGLFAALVLAACAHRDMLASNHASAGIALAIYEHNGSGGAPEGYAIVDDRREVDIAGNELVLSDVDPGAELASLEIVPIGGHVAIGTCTRDRLPIDLTAPPSGSAAGRAQVPAIEAAAPVGEVRCAVTAGSGRHLVRLLYTSKAIAYRAEHWIAVDGDHATVTSHYAITTPSWHGARADVALFDGVPGGEPPKLVARGSITLDGSTSVLVAAPVATAATVRRVYAGADVDSPASADSTARDWGANATNDVWVMLDLPNAQLAPGEAYVHLAQPDELERDVHVPTAHRHIVATAVRFALWNDVGMHEARERTNDGPTELALVDRLMFSISNEGETTRDVWIEEPLRAVTLAGIERSWPHKPEIVGDIVREKVSIAPHMLERVGFTLRYRQ